MKLKILGIISFLTGCIFILNSFSEITGFAVAGYVGKEASSVFGLIFIVGGIILFLIERKERGLVRIIETKRFKKAIRRHPTKPIEAAIKKIGTNLAKDESLRYLEGRSVRTSKGGRILYNRRGNEITLNDYLPPSKHY